MSVYVCVRERGMCVCERERKCCVWGKAAAYYKSVAAAGAKRIWVKVKKLVERKK